MTFDDEHAVTLEISALQYFPWLIAEAEHAIEHRELMPGRYIRVRNMAEQTAPGEDVLAVAAAMQIIGASHVETLDTKGIDGSNVHLGGPDTIAGYFGGIGQPNDYPIKWADEYLRNLTEYGIRQVLNINSGTILVAMLLHKLGVRNEFKVSVFMGVDNPFSVLWLLMGARLFGAEHGTTGMAGLNLSNSVDATTIRQSSAVRKAFGLEQDVRFEHHITEAYKSIVRQPYLRRDELLDVAADVPNISAKHEGADPDDRGRARAPERHLRLLRAEAAAHGHRAHAGAASRTTSTSTPPCAARQRSSRARASACTPRRCCTRRRRRRSVRPRSECGRGVSARS